MISSPNVIFPFQVVCFRPGAITRGSLRLLTIFDGHGTGGKIAADARVKSFPGLASKPTSEFLSVDENHFHEFEKNLHARHLFFHT